MIFRGAGALIALLGLAVVGGWVVRLPAIVQILPGLAPMQFNTALSFVLLGAGIFTAHRVPSPFVYFCGFAPAVIGALTLLEYGAEFDLLIDELFMDHFLPAQSIFPGRMSPPTALCFILMGLALFGIASQRSGSNALAVACSTTVALIALFSLANHAGLASPVTRFRWSAMALHTAGGFLAAGIAVGLEGHGRVRTEADRPWLAPAVCVLSTMLVVFVWQNRSTQERQYILQKTKEIALLLRENLEQNVKMRTFQIQRMVERWRVSNGIPADIWVPDAKNYIEHNDDLLGITVLDANARVRYAVKRPGATWNAFSPFDLDSAAKTDPVYFPDRSDADPVFFIAFPLQAGTRPDGQLHAVLNMRTFLQSSARVTPFYRTVVRSQGGELFDSHPGTAGLANWTVRESFTLGGRGLTIEVEPLAAYLKADMTILPELDLIVGSALAIFAAMTTHLLEVNRKRTRQLREFNETLEERVQERSADANRARVSAETSEERFRTLLNSTPDGMVFVNQEGRIILTNQRIRDLLGYEPDDLRGESIENLIPEHIRDGHSQKRDSFFANPEPRAMAAGRELLGRHRDGSVVPVEITLSPLEIDGEPVVCAAIRDISEKIEVNHKAVMLTALVENSPDVILTCDADSNLTYMNPAGRKFVGLEPDAKTLGHLSDYLVLDEKDPLGNQFRSFKKSGTVVSNRFLRNRTNGTQVPVEAHAFMVHRDDNHGYTIGFIARDQRNRIHLEEDIRRKNEMWRSLVEGSPDFINVLDEEFRLRFLNRIGLGYRMEDLMGRDFRDLVDPDERERVSGFLEEARAGGRLVSYESNGVTADGVHRYFRNRLSPIMENDRVVSLVLTVSEITEQKQAEHAIRRQEAYWRSVVENTPDHILVINRDLLVEFLNFTTHGFRLEDIVGKSFSDIATGESLAMVRRCLTEGEPLSFESNLVGPDGVDAWYDQRLSPIQVDGIITGVVLAITEITEKKRIEHELQENAAALGRLLSEVKRSNEELQQFAYVTSHDLQEPLRGIAGCLQIVERRYRDRLDPQAGELIDHAVRGAERLRTMINDLLDYSRVNTQGERFRNQEFNSLFDQALENLRFSIEETAAEVRRENLPALPCDPSQIIRLFQNLIENALKFRGPEPCRVITTARQVGGEWIFSVRDNGIGIDPKHAERIFAIFQRLHGREKYPGTGIGLAICKRIVLRHGGRIWVESQPGQGCDFSFVIPVHPEEQNV